MTYVAIDIGGANLKISNGADYGACVPLALWRDHHRLTSELRRALAAVRDWQTLAVTMTGELADCFPAKTEGVHAILEAVAAAAEGRTVLVYLVDGRLVSPTEAGRAPELAAASNWHALARFAGRYVNRGPAVLLDIGSTTTDIIPLANGAPMALGRNDTERLMAGELVYTGVERSPICSIVDRLPYRGQSCPVAGEFFATARDAYLLLGELPQRPNDLDTADGRPATAQAAHARMARMICADASQFDGRDARDAATAVAERQAGTIADAAGQVLARIGRPADVVLSGHGGFLASRVLQEMESAVARVVSLTDLLGPQCSRCATAYALAVLARDASDQ
jgi:probable H4MPT-linked C1 transfer pathway protein